MWFFKKNKGDEEQPSNPAASPRPKRTPIPYVSVGELKQKIESGDADIQVIDVREPWEWQGGHIHGATHIPLGLLPAKLDQLDRNRDIYLICQSGIRSAQATRVLRNNGFDRSYNVDGGMSEWDAQAYPSVQESVQDD